MVWMMNSMANFPLITQENYLCRMRKDQILFSSGSEPRIIVGLVYGESHPWALTRSLDAYGELQVPITNNAKKSHTMQSSHFIVAG